MGCGASSEVEPSVQRKEGSSHVGPLAVIKNKNSGNDISYTSHSEHAESRSDQATSHESSAKPETTVYIYNINHQYTDRANNADHKKKGPKRAKGKRCYFCNERNHGTRDCKHGVQIQCYKCGGWGHKAKHHSSTGIL